MSAADGNAIVNGVEPNVGKKLANAAFVKDGFVDIYCCWTLVEEGCLNVEGQAFIKATDFEGLGPRAQGVKAHQIACTL